jgi:hypothetical protein
MTAKYDQPTQDGGTPCDPEAIEDLACTAKKYDRQAEVMDEVAADLETYRTQFAAARKQYSDAREAASQEIDAIRQQLDELGEQLRCRLTDEQKHCLVQARDKVFAEIDECTGPRGCCLTPCDSDDDAGKAAAQSYQDSDDEQEIDIVALTAAIDQLRRDLTANAACFAKLIAEPDEITKRVAALKAEATALATAVAAGGDASKVVVWYARWLILDTSLTLSRIGSGFDSVSAYYDCLCSVLQCLISGWKRLAVLEGIKAWYECKEDAKQKACQKKQENVLTALLEEYEDCYEGAESAGAEASM